MLIKHFMGSPTPEQRFGSNVFVTIGLDGFGAEFDHFFVVT